MFGSDCLSVRFRPEAVVQIRISLPTPIGDDLVNIPSHFTCFVLLIVATLGGCATPKQIAIDSEIRHLCEIDGGVKVYETVTLSPEYFDSWGNLPIPSMADAKPSDNYYYIRETTILRSSDPVIWRSRHAVIRRSDNKVLGESIRYARRGGDVPGPWHESSFGCPDTAAQPSLEKSIFVMKRKS